MKAQTCPNCRVRVMPSSDGECPSCRQVSFASEQTNERLVAPRDFEAEKTSPESLAPPPASLPLQPEPEPYRDGDGPGLSPPAGLQTPTDGAAGVAHQSVKDLGRPIVAVFKMVPGLHLFKSEQRGLIGLLEWVVDFFLMACIGIFFWLLFCLGIPALLAILLVKLVGPWLPAHGDIVVYAVFELAGLWYFLKHSLIGEIGRWFWQRRSHADVEVCENGVRVRFRDGRVVELPFADIAVFEGGTSTIAPAGRFWGERWRLVLYREEGAGQTKALELWGDFRGSAAAGHPVLTLWRRCQDAASQRLTERLRSGRDFRSQGWELTAETLSAGGKTIALADVTGAAIQNGRVCVWTRGAEEPVLRFPWATPNAPVVLSLLEQRTKANPTEKTGLGRVIVKKWWFGWDGAFLTIILPVLGAFVVIFMNDAHLSEYAIDSVAAVLLAAWGFAVYRLARRKFRVHDRGVFMRGVFSTISLQDDEIGGFSYTTTRYYVNGVYQGLIYNVTAVPHASTGKWTIRFRALLRSIAEEELDAFRDRLAHRLAQQMLDIVRNGRECDWCRAMTLGPREMCLKPQGLFGAGKEVRVPYSDVAGLQLSLGKCNVVLHSTGKPAASVSQADHNFWPAYHAARILIEENRS